ncbi:MAG: NAD-dependent epimerase/dehydratase family protein [Cytophagaceae bacterium]
MKVALIAGSTGLVGTELLNVLDESNQFSKIYALTRRKNSIRETEKIKALLADPINSMDWPSDVDEVFCCLGTTMKKAGSKEAFRKVDFELVVELAKKAKNNGVNSFHVISSMGADKNSFFFYNKVKGEMQEALEKLNFGRLFIYQPSLLLGDRKETRIGEKIGEFIMKAFSSLLLGSLKKYKAIEARTVAKAMEKIANSKESRAVIFDSGKIRKLAADV